MFRRQLACMVLLWFLCVFACLWMWQSASPQAELAYQRLMSMSDQSNEEHFKQNERPVQQTRQGVSKQIFYAKDGERRQSRLSSEKSEMVFDQRDGKGELSEHFSDLTCVLQEKTEDAGHGHHIRRLKARQAVYSYKSGQLEAQDVVVADYLIPGEQWPVSYDHFSPTIQGQAQKVHVSLFNRETAVKAQGFQGAFHDDEEGGW